MSRVPLERTTFALPGGVFHALVGGPPAGRPLVFLHGFPDHPPTARAFLEQLARTRRVIAPWLRGYAPSPTSGPFALADLSRDVVQLATLLGEPIDLVGHDWGAAITYDVCAHVPALIHRAVTMALPHPLTFLRAQRRAAQRRASAYIALFQLPFAERIVDAAFIDRLWRTWSPELTLSAEQQHELHACLAASMPAPLAYYRAALRSLGGAAKRYRRAARPVAVPLLQLHGDRDGCVLIPDEEWPDSELFAERTFERVAGGGHFLHVEDPSKIADRVVAWLA